MKVFAIILPSLPHTVSDSRWLQFTVFEKLWYILRLSGNKTEFKFLQMKFYFSDLIKTNLNNCYLWFSVMFMLF